MSDSPPSRLKRFWPTNLVCRKVSKISDSFSLSRIRRCSSRGSDSCGRSTRSWIHLRWVGSEIWHPDQRGVYDPAGRYTLELPYRDDRELLLEILKHGAGVEVLAPPELRTKVRDAHLEAARVNAPKP